MQPHRFDNPDNPLKFHPTHHVYFNPEPAVLARLPQDSRLFLGHLPLSLTREKLAEVFVPYGNIFEISLKGVYGFIQFETPEACRKAASEQDGLLVNGAAIRRAFPCTVCDLTARMQSGAWLVSQEPGQGIHAQEGFKR